MKFCPYDYQIEGIRFLHDTPRANLFWDMGLGKSAVSLQMIMNLKYDFFSMRKALIVAPKRVATVGWPLEIEKWDNFKDLKYHVLYGKNRTRPIPNCDIVLTTYETVTWLQENRPEVSSLFDVVIFDESTYLKNEGSRRWQATFGMFCAVPRIVMLTGTPIPNGIADIWAPMYVLDNGKRLGRTRTIYRDEYFSLGGHNGMKYVPRRGSLPKILDKVKDISHTLKSEDYISLPGMMINSVPVKLNPKTMDLYSSMEKKFFMTIDGEDIEAVNAAAKSGKLRQITCGFSYNDQGDPVAIPGAREKMKALQEILEAYPYESFIIVAEFTELANQLIKKIKGSVAINGSTSVTESMKAVQGWNSGKVRRLVVHPASVSHGMNLQFGGRMIVWMGPIWNLEYWLQLNARLHRQGQIRPVIVNVLTAVNTIDVVVASRLKQKGATQDTLLAGIREYWDQKRGATNGAIKN